MNNKNNINVLNEIKNYRTDVLNNLLLDQSQNRSFIVSHCEKCVFHSTILHNNTIIHICNDAWSGMGHTKYGIGKHIFYCETMDICLEYNGFKVK